MLDLIFNNIIENPTLSFSYISEPFSIINLIKFILPYLVEASKGEYPFYKNKI